MASLCYVVIEIMVNIGSHNGLLPHDSNPLPELMLIAHLYGPHLRAISQEMPNISILDMSLNITNSISQVNLPVAKS